MNVNPKDLQIDHPFRNSSLGIIGAECRNIQSKTWRPVAKWKISKNTYNELFPVWTEGNEWRIDEGKHSAGIKL